MNVFQMWDIAFIPDNVKPNIDRENDAKTYSWDGTV
jgi:UV DNA damage repair endonuclease